MQESNLLVNKSSKLIFISILWWETTKFTEEVKKKDQMFDQSWRRWLFSFVWKIFIEGMLKLSRN